MSDFGKLVKTYNAYVKVLHRICDEEKQLPLHPAEPSSVRIRNYKGYMNEAGLKQGVASDWNSVRSILTYLDSCLNHYSKLVYYVAKRREIDIIKEVR